ncbi:hypothetical protein FRC02_004973 [Tulasnella sp. 418]|nr:hypothetical protein FRC02_004973 [Tulasnella sp. 418]
MEVSFLASGAVNRTHFSLAQKVESASDPGVADEAIIHEIDAIRAKFDKPTFGPISSACRDWLLILLYCETSLTFELPRSDYLHFALPYAVQLAEGGKTLQNRYVGYLFCSMIMPQNHELQLMLVNTCRKDIESPEAARICLALDFLIRCPTSYVIPAISNRLEDLLSHDSQHVRRRVLSAFRILSAYDREILKRTTRKLRKRMKEEGASGTAFLLAMELVRNGLLPNQSAITIVMDVLKRYLSTSGVNASPGIVKAVSVLGRLVTQEQDADILSSAFDMILKLMKRSTDRKHPSHGTFKTLLSQFLLT